MKPEEISNRVRLKIAMKVIGGDFDKYMAEVESQNGKDIVESVDFDEIISGVFEWDKTEDPKYWNNLDNKFQEYLEIYIGE